MSSSLRTQQVGEAAVKWVPLKTPTLPPATHTNCVLLGRGRYFAVDPASPWPEEQARLAAIVGGLETQGETLAGILLTHHHFDHVSGANALHAATGAPVYAHARTRDKLAGVIAIDHLLDDGDTLPIDERWELVWTPGHAPGHLCAQSDDGVLVAGDMVAAIGTIVIEPDDDGDMALYLASLARLRERRATCLVPAHGEVILDADAKLAGYITHRLAREAKAQAALSTTPTALLDLVPRVYPEVAPLLYPLAARSLYAHLLKLEQDGAARRQGDDWRTP